MSITLTFPVCLCHERGFSTRQVCRRNVVTRDGTCNPKQNKHQQKTDLKKGAGKEKQRDIFTVNPDHSSLSDPEQRSIVQEDPDEVQ